MESGQTGRPVDPREPGEPYGRERGTGRRALLGAAVLGAGGAVLGLSGTARATEAEGAGTAARTAAG